MWIFTTDGFFSITKEINGNRIQVRSRLRSDMDNFIKSIGGIHEIHKDIGTDYRFRIFVDKRHVDYYLKKYVKNLGYSNFKNEVSRKRKDKKTISRILSYYHDVWNSMWNMQEDFRKKGL